MVGELPAMGFNTWNDVRCNVTLERVLGLADALVASGLAARGYRYLNIDDCWSQPKLAEDGQLVPKFDMGRCGNELRRRGLRLGLYADRGFKTCAFFPGSRGLEEVHARQFAEWGVDYLKYDSCFAPNLRRKGALEDYARMREALNATGRPMVFSACGWSAWYAPHRPGHSWRISADCDEWANVYVAARTNEGLSQFAGRGAFNDPDMLLGSTEGSAASLTPRQSRAQFALWAVMTAPLLIGANLETLSSFDLETYSNEAIIAVDQDPLAEQGVPVLSTCPPFEPLDNWWCSPWSMPADVFAGWQNALISLALAALVAALVFRRRAFLVLAALALAYVCVLRASRPRVHRCHQVWAKPLVDGVALAFVNWDGPAVNLTCDVSCLRAANLLGPKPRFLVRDLHAHTHFTLDLQDEQTSGLTAYLQPDGDARLFRITPLPGAPAFDDPPLRPPMLD